MTQRHIGALLSCVCLICAALLLQGATVRIPPTRSPAISVRSAGTGTGTGTAANNTFDRSELFAEWLPSRYTAPDLTDPINGNTLSAPAEAQRPAVASTSLYFIGWAGFEDYTSIKTSGNVVGRDTSKPFTAVIKIGLVDSWATDFGQSTEIFLTCGWRAYRWSGQATSLVFQSTPCFVVDPASVKGNTYTYVMTHTPGSTCKIYRDNSTNATVGGSGAFSSDGPCTIGGGVSAAYVHAFHFYGMRLFNRVLSDTEIDAVTTWDWSF